MFRRMFVVVALLAGVMGHASARPTEKAEKAEKAKAKAKPKKSTSTTAKAKAKSKRKTDDKQAKRRQSKSARIGRVPTRAILARGAGMPHGFSWPPTRAMLAAEAACETRLEATNIAWERAPTTGRIAGPVLVPAMVFGGVRFTNMWGSKGPFPLDCQLALALETIGPELHAIGVREVKFGSLYRWSNIRSHGVTRPMLSRHGLGLAMDIGSFVDDQGREAVVKRDYPQDDALLLAIEQLINANGNFRIVLTPKNDPVSHADHFHIEARSEFVPSR
jgi:hypothetical protein